MTQEGWAATAGPLQPTRVTRHYGVASTGGGLVAADPGVAGYWVARTFATTELGGVQVPSDAGAAGFAVACGIVARLRDPDRPVLAVVDGPVAPIVEQVLEVGRRLGVDVPVEVWQPDGEALDPDAHLARLRDLVAARLGHRHPRHRPHPARPHGRRRRRGGRLGRLRRRFRDLGLARQAQVPETTSVQAWRATRRPRQSVHPATWSARACSVGLAEWVTTTSVPTSSATSVTSTSVVSSSPSHCHEVVNR